MKKAPLITIAEVIRGVSFSKDEGSGFKSEGRLPVIRAGSIQESLHLDEGQIWVPEGKIKENQKIRRDDIVMCTSSGSSSLVGKCSGQLIPDSILSFSSATTGGMPSLNVWGRCRL